MTNTMLENNEMAHDYATPAPWTIADDVEMKLQCEQLMADEGTARQWTAIHDIHEDGPEVVALCHPANAAFIVRAVNSHDALVEALEACAPILDKLLPFEHDYEREAERKLIAALAKAKE